MSGQEPNGLAECSLLCLRDGMAVTNGLSLGICAIDYQGDPYLESYTPGLVSNIVSHYKELYLFANSFLLFLRLCMKSW
jgi:hypothetical protein